MISSPNRSSRGKAPVRLIVIHTAEGARTAAALGAYFAKPAAQSSSHVGIDDAVVEQYVPYDQAAWTIRSANPISDNAELCGFAAWTRDQWLGEHRRMLELAAGWIRERCLARGIPIRKLTPAQVGAGAAGVCGHVDWTLGTGDGTHTDPGKGFPWDVVMEMANCNAPTDGGFLMALNDSEQDEVLDAARSSLFGKEGVRVAGEGALVIAGIRDQVKALDAKLDRVLAALGKA